MVNQTEEAKNLSESEALRRRSLLKQAVLGGGAAVAGLMASSMAKAATAPTAKEQDAQAAVDRATRGMPSPKIVDVKVIAPFTVVKVITDQPGLYGYGEAGVEVRSKLVTSAVEDYLKPLVIGRATDRIEEIWQLLYLSSYYKNDHVQNAAISGICDALWDIKGRQANMPVYQLVGGKCRDAAEVYMHSLARPFEPKLVVENSKKLVKEQGARNIQVDIFQRDAEVKTLDGGMGYDRDLSYRQCMAAFAAFRKELPPDVRLGVDIHSMMDPIRAVAFCKDAEQFKPWYWVEDPVSPENQEHLTLIRQNSSVPLSFGELWNNPAEWRSIIDRRLTDYIRHHISHIGGFTPARKVAAFAENYEVRTGWHAAGNSPVGHMARLTLDVTCPNFGIHEHFAFPDRVREIFRGIHEVKNGYAYVSEKPGWGIEIDEAAAAKLPPGNENSRRNRLPDGSYYLGVG